MKDRLAQRREKRHQAELAKEEEEKKKQEAEAEAKKSKAAAARERLVRWSHSNPGPTYSWLAESCPNKIISWDWYNHEQCAASEIFCLFNNRLELVLTTFQERTAISPQTG